MLRISSKCARSKLISFVAAIALASPLIRSASAHDYWSDGTRVDPVTKWLCCSDSDHFLLDDSQVRKVEQGFRVSGRFDTKEGPVGIDELINWERVKPSPDGRFHAFIDGDGDIRCFFAPIVF
jgi:hypothetical protein